MGDECEDEHGGAQHDSRHPIGTAAVLREASGGVRFTAWTTSARISTRSAPPLYLVGPISPLQCDSSGALATPPARSYIHRPYRFPSFCITHTPQICLKNDHGSAQTKGQDTKPSTPARREDARTHRRTVIGISKGRPAAWVMGMRRAARPDAPPPPPPAPSPPRRPPRDAPRRWPPAPPRASAAHDVTCASHKKKRFEAGGAGHSNA